MSSTESSNAPAEASATTPALNAESSFGSTRGSGLARGKAKRPSAPAAASAASAEYTPTAIAVVTAPREYQNPFAPVETPVAVTESAAPVAPAPVAAAPVAPVKAPAAVIAAPVQVAHEEPAELNILEPEQQKTAPAQTWESEGFRPARESRHDRPRREEARRDEPRRAASPAQEPFDPTSIPEKYIYVRPGYNYVPTPSNFGGAPRENRSTRPAAPDASAAPRSPAPAPSRGFFSWLKSLFTSSPSTSASAAAPSGDRAYHRNRGDRGRSSHGGSGGGEGQRRRSRGGRGRSQSRGDYRGGGDQGSSQGGV